MLCGLRHRILHGTGKVPPLDRELDADEAAVVLAIDEGGAIADRDIGQLLQRDLLTAGGRHQNIADCYRIVAILALEPNDEIEFLVLLNDLRGDVAADRGLDEVVYIVDVEPEAGDLRSVDLDREARLAEFLNQRDVADARGRVPKRP